MAENDDRDALMKQALIKIKQYKTELKKLHEPIAIIGVGCRLPAGLNSPEHLWDALVDGVDGISEIPKERFSIDSYYDPEPGKPGKIITRKGGFIDHIDQFDAAFFGINPREAEVMDPQQRLLLEVTWEALERASIAPGRLRNSKTGVFLGVSKDDYGALLLEQKEKAGTNPYAASGNALNALSGRLSYFFGLQGPSISLDMGCASSIFAINAACKSIQTGEIDLAIAGCANIIISPSYFSQLSAAEMLSPDGYCKSFDDSADGYGRGEGIGVLILKRLSDAERDQDHILAVIKGSAINQNGPGSALSVPNGVAQETVIREALSQAKIQPEEVSFIEAQGSGTSLGDMIEMNALGEVYGKSRDVQNPLQIGAIASNIGHLEEAAGFASIMKVLLALSQKKIPANIHFKQLNPKIDLESISAKIVTKLSDWSVEEGEKRIAGINSFSFTGSNAHLLLEEAPELLLDGEKPEFPYYILPLSAKSESALQELVSTFLDFLKTTPENIASIIYTSCIGREQFEYRTSFVATSKEEMIKKLEQSKSSFSKVDLEKRVKLKFEYTAEGGYTKEEKKNSILLTVGPEADWEKLVSDTSREYLDGAEIDWLSFYAPYSISKVVLPTYPFQRGSFWALSPPSEILSEESKSEVLSVDKNVREYILEMFSESLKIPIDKISTDQNFSTYGIDSVLINEMNRKLSKKFGEVSSTLFFKYKNLDQLINFFEGSFEGEVETAPLSSEHNDQREKDIAIIGMSGIFPLAKDVVEFWENLKGGRDCITEVPQSRQEQLKSPYGKWGGFIEGVDQFDMDFFEIAPIEAKFTSPNERLFLQETWKCIESAGYRPDNLVKEPGARVGVFVGVSYNDYGFFANDVPLSEKRTPPISQTYSIANRVSYFCDFTGPSFAFDTACSTSLYALHLAVESIHNGDCQVAIAGGVNLTLHPSKFELLKKFGFTAEDGRCHSFGEGGTGYVPGEGVGAVLLKPLDLAVKDGDNILGVIKGTGISQDGKTNYYSVPNPVAQTEAINIALDKAGVDPRTITYVEAHGTGTSLGDPIEISGLEDAYQPRTPDKQYCAIGSVKSNIGHCEAAAGVSQIIKVLLQLQTKMICPNLTHSENLNPNINFTKSPFYVQQKLSPWKPYKDFPLRAGVSSFGAGGVNAHAIVEGYTPANNRHVGEDTFIIPISAKKIESLKIMVSHLHSFIKKRAGDKDAVFGDINLPDIAYTLQVGRVSMRHRLVFVVKNISDLIQKLESVLEDPEQFNSLVYDKQEGMKKQVEIEKEIAKKNLEGIASAWREGADIPWEKLHSECNHQRVYLPTYSFATERCWVEGDIQEKPVIIEEAAVEKVEGSPLLMSLNDIPESEQYKILLKYLQDLIAEKLQYPPNKLPDIEHGLFELGITSLQAIEIQNEIQSELGIKISDTASFDYPTLKTFTQYLLELVSQKLIPVQTQEEEAPEIKEDVITDDIAIIGMSCRFPGGCDTPEAFWEFISEGGDGICDMPPERWDVNRFYDPDPEALGKMYVKKGGFLSQKIDEFDAKLFNISPSEANSLDPQQRLLLEGAWEAFENASIDPTSLTGSKTGVFIGMTVPEYTNLDRDKRHHDYTKISPYWATGMITCLASGRIAHFFGLHGPAITLDTACSSSLVATHLACESLRKGECDMALAGGAFLMLTPVSFIGLSRVHALAPDGRCKTFDASGDGYGRSEGVGTIVLKRLSSAIKDGDRIEAVIKGSAVNQDGPSSGLTVPNGNAQEMLIREALKNAQLLPKDISYLEAHGTGTSLGDPIEMRSVSNVLGENRESDHPLVLGAVKRNIGHTEAAAGVAGIIKASLCLQHKKIPPLKVEKVNPRIHLDQIPAIIPDSLTEWNTNGNQRYAGISSFGFSGTNAHMILSEAPEAESLSNAIDRPSHIVALSAQTKEALQAVVENFSRFLESSDASLPDIAYSTNVGRAHFPIRAAFVVNSKNALKEQIANYKVSEEEQKTAGEVIFIATEFLPETNVHSYGKQFYNNFPTYKRAIEKLDPLVETILGNSVSEILYSEKDRELDELQKQAAQFAIEYAICALWRSWGITPEAVYGEGPGAYVAACIAEIMDEEAALSLLLDSSKQQSLKINPPKISFISSQTGKAVKSSEVTSIEYWQKQRTSTPDRSTALQTIQGRGLNELIQINPGKQLIDSDRYFQSIIRSDDCETIIQSLACLYMDGMNVNWKNFDRDYHRQKVVLPNYPFQRKRYWIELDSEQYAPSMTYDEMPPLVGMPLPAFDAQHLFMHKISRQNLSELNDVNGVVHVGFYQEMLLNALKNIGDVESYTVKDMSYTLPLIVGQEEGASVLLTMNKAEADTFAFKFQSFQEGANTWSLHTQGVLSLCKPKLTSWTMIDETLKKKNPTYDHEAFYQMLAKRGVELGKSVALVEKVWVSRTDVLANLSPVSVDNQQLSINPGLLDACAQLFHAALPENAPPDLSIMVSKFGLFYIDLNQSYKELWCSVRMEKDPKSKDGYIGDFVLQNEKGDLILECQKCQMQSFTHEDLQQLKAAMKKTKIDKSEAKVLQKALEKSTPEERRELISEMLKEELTSLLGLPKEEIRSEESIINFGMDSILGISFKNAISSKLGVDLPIDEVIIGPTIEELTSTIMGDIGGVTSEKPLWFPEKMKANAEMRLFCLPYGGGGASIYRDWQTLFPETIDVCPIQFPGREQRIKEIPYTDIYSLVDDLTVAIENRLDLPFAILGHSSGILIGYLLAMNLSKKKGVQPVHLFPSAFTSPDVLSPRLLDLKSHFEKIGLLEAYSKNELTQEQVDLVIKEKVFVETQDMPYEIALLFLKVAIPDLKIVESYHHEEGQIGCDITAFFGSEDTIVPEGDLKGWKSLTKGSFDLHEMGGDHLFINDPNVRDQMMKIILKKMLPSK